MENCLPFTDDVMVVLVHKCVQQTHLLALHLETLGYILLRIIKSSVTFRFLKLMVFCVWPLFSILMTINTVVKAIKEQVKSSSTYLRAIKKIMVHYILFLVF